MLISAAALAAVFYFADFQELITAMQVADYRYVAIGAGLTLVWLAVRALAWRTLMQNRAHLRDVFLALNQGYLLNNLLPFRLGEVGRAFLLGRKTPLGFWQVFSSILIERSLDLALAAGLLLSTIPFVVGAGWARQGAIFSAVVVTAALAGLFLMARSQSWAEARFQALGERWPVLLKVGGGRLPAFLNGLSVLTEGGLFFPALGLMVACWLIGIAQYYMVLLAFFPNAQLLWAAFALGVTSVGIAAPSSPGAIGVMEAAVVGALSLFNLDPSRALAYALTLHVVQYVVTGILGAYGLSRDGETVSGIYKSARGLLSKTP